MKVPYDTMTGVLSTKDIILDYFPNSNEMSIINNNNNNNNNNQLSMEEILARDQRTTSHRVIHRDGSPRSEMNNNQGSSQSASNNSSIGVLLENIDNNKNKNNNNNKSAAKKVFGAIGVERTNELATNCTGSEDNNCSSEMRTSYNNDNDNNNKRIRGYAGYRGFTFVTGLRLGSLLVTLLVVSIQGAPTMSSNDERSMEVGMWVNPCGIYTETPETDGRSTDSLQLINTASDYQSLTQIYIKAQTSYMEAERFKKELLETIFHNDLHEDWKLHRYDWLPSKEDIPKNLNESLDQEFLDKLELDSALIDAYQIMQKYAVALEQVVWDQPDQNHPQCEGFCRAKRNVRGVLCEILSALDERQVDKGRRHPDVERSIMGPKFRDLGRQGDTYRNMRDWLIFRDYMNGLEYIKQVFDHLRKKIKT